VTWVLKVKQLIFNLVFLTISLNFFNINGEEIIAEYINIKSDLKTESVTETDNYFFATSYSKNSSIVKNDVEKNKVLANSKLINHLSSLIDWPKKIPSYLKKALWEYYKSNNKYVFEGSQIVDQGLIGEYYFVVVGIPREELLQNKVAYNQILRQIKK